ncbi:LuxR family transcriptional regulator [Marinomonas hwangdonensis]|uniref:LuxR family transcriptional regulator n=1 Tax=Marinomonas hwangdonensis TaxID=1053647 RepID=A0A3M8Q931_9GAMM|nr:helix-turn-helix transcriptional regulator [Marinomonas hwangdonensis]RNF51570.1 LuxR family transcriptional regulator [Marinomonas hwangdonensis]
MSAYYVNKLLPELYRCVDHPMQWVKVLDQLRDDLDVSSVVVQVFGRSNTGDLVQNWVMRDSFSLANAALHDKWVNNADNPRMHTETTDSLAIIRDEEIFSLSSPTVECFYERLKQARLGHAISLEIKSSNNQYITLIAHRKYGDKRGFGLSFDECFQQLAPHIQQSIVLSEKLNTLSLQNAYINQVTNHINTGMMLLTLGGSVYWSNQCATELVQRSEHIRLIDGHLTFTHSTDQQVFNALFAKASQQRKAFPRLIATIGQYRLNPLQLLVTCVNVQAGDSMPSETVIGIFFSENDNGFAQLDCAQLNVTQLNREVGQLYGLTPAESRLAVALANGLSLEEYSQQKGVSIGTVRIQLKSIFSKMNITRQQELVRMLWASVSARTRPVINPSLSIDSQSS